MKVWKHVHAEVPIIPYSHPQTENAKVESYKKQVNRESYPKII